MLPFATTAAVIALLAVFILDTGSCSAPKDDTPNFLDQHVLCSDARVIDLVNFTKHTNCREFLAKEVIVTPLSSERFSQPMYHQLAANLLGAVKNGVLRVGLSGGSITNLWSRPFKMMAEKVFRSMGNNFNGHEDSTGTLVRVMDGAIAATGALIPAGCPTNLLGDSNLDVIIVEFAANDQDEQHLRSLVRVLQNTYKNAAIVILELTTLKARHPMPKPWLAAGVITKEFNLPLVNWSAVVDIGFNKTFDPYEIWSTFDPVHPKHVGVSWIALSVLETLEAVYQHNVALHDTIALRAVPLPDYNARANVSGQVCITDYCTGGFPRDLSDRESKARTRYDRHATAGACWKLHRHKQGSEEACSRYARHFNASRCPADTREDARRVMKFDVTVTVPCQLAIALIGNGNWKAQVQCNMDVLDNGAPHSVVHAAHLSLLTQTVVQLSRLEPGAHVISLVPVVQLGLNESVKERRVGQEEMCNVSGLMCIPL
jgi:hypothetical protein